MWIWLQQMLINEGKFKNQSTCRRTLEVDEFLGHTPALDDDAVLIQPVIHADFEVNIWIGHPHRYSHRNSSDTEGQLNMNRCKVSGATWSCMLKKQLLPQVFRFKLFPQTLGSPNYRREWKICLLSLGMGNVCGPPDIFLTWPLATLAGANGS